MRRPWLARLLCAMLCFLILTTVIACFPSGRDGNTEPSASQTSTEGTTPLPQAPQMPNEEKPLHRVAYIPIDNRPVNRERVAYLAESVGIELLMPKEEFYRTALDNMEPNADGSVAMEQIVCRTNLKLEVDTYWAFVGMKNPVSFLERVQDRLIAVHMKDGSPDGHGTPLGMGDAPVAEVYEWVKAHNIPMVVESETCTPDGMTEAKICIEYLKSLEG